MDLSPHTSSGNGGFAGAGAGASLTPAQTPISNPATADPGDDQKQNLNQVINSIQKTLGLLHQLYLTVSSFNVAAQMPLLQRLNTLVGELDTMQKLADNCNIQVPMEVLNLIDDGKNPDEFTKDVLNSCIAKNQITKGKTDAFKSMRKYLLEDLEQAFPNEVEAYREIRATSAAQSNYQERRREREEERSGGEGREEERGERKRRRVERDEREEKFKEARRLAQSQNALPNGDAKVKSEH